MKKTASYMKIIVMILISLCFFIRGGEVQAVLQSNPNTQYKTKKALGSWVGAMRNLESAMGLTETRNSNLTPVVNAEGKTNNIDVHCIKTSEYGAVAILSASGYGNQSTAKAITTTTGNNTGMILNTGYWEITSGYGGSLSIDGRYYNSYPKGDLSKTTAKRGDALVDCRWWHSATYGNYIQTGSANTYCFGRGYGGIFSFSGYGTTGTTSAGNSFYYGSSSDDGGSYSWASRAVAVCGEGL